MSEFDRQAAKDQAKHEDSDGYFGFISGAEWQHSILVPLINQLTKERDDLRYLHDRIAERVMPGTTDSCDAMVQIIRERDALKKIVDELQHVRMKGDGRE